MAAAACVVIHEAEGVRTAVDFSAAVVEAVEVVIVVVVGDLGVLMVVVVPEVVVVHNLLVWEKKSLGIPWNRRSYGQLAVSPKFSISVPLLQRIPV